MSNHDVTAGSRTTEEPKIATWVTWLSQRGISASHDRKVPARREDGFGGMHRTSAVSHPGFPRSRSGRSNHMGMPVHRDCDAMLVPRHGTSQERPACLDAVLVMGAWSGYRYRAIRAEHGLDPRSKLRSSVLLLPSSKDGRRRLHAGATNMAGMPMSRGGLSFCPSHPKPATASNVRMPPRTISRCSTTPVHVPSALSAPAPCQPCAAVGTGARGQSSMTL